MIASPIDSKAQRSRPFPLGRVVLTAGARDALSDPQAIDLIQRHAKGDFGSLSTEDFDANLDAIVRGDRIVSVYPCSDARFYVITEADRSVTTVLLAEEY